MTDRYEELLARVEKLEIREACVSTFNEYLHYLDADYLEELLMVFAEDAELTVVDYPPGSGENLFFNGRTEIRKLYEPHKSGIGRHHSANVTVVVSDDRTSAELSSYFITSGPFGFGGGLYQIVMKPVDGVWRFSTVSIISTWGWRVETDAEPYLAKALGEGANRGGRPILYR